ncbi:MAG: hypothetical protein Q9178_005985 [Gyalolechia marmorata]
MLVQIFQCQPREKIWHPLLPGRCVDLAAVLISGAVINVISDLSILVLPVAKIWQLQMRTSRKLSLSVVFGTGLFACISSIMRMVNNVQYAQTQDYTFRLTAVALWTLGEIASGMVCSCLPVVPAFFRHYMPKVTSSFRSSLEKVKGSRSGGQESLSRSGSEWDRERGFVELMDQKASKRARLEYEPDGRGLVMDGHGGKRDGVEVR